MSAESQDPELMSFSDWIHGRPELQLHLDNLRKEAEQMLKIDFFGTEKEYASIYESRGGNVLVS
mgnify:CR=1 FL=1